MKYDYLCFTPDDSCRYNPSMKKMIKTASLLLPIVLLISGCALFSGGGRDTTSPDKALIGHWRMRDGSGEVYFSRDGQYRYIDAAGIIGTADYEIIEQDSETRSIWVKIRLKEYAGQPIAEDLELTVAGEFSPDYFTHTGESVGKGGARISSFILEYEGPEEEPED